jgi:hypothetical protein
MCWAYTWIRYGQGLRLGLSYAYARASRAVGEAIMLVRVYTWQGITYAVYVVNGMRVTIAR